MKAEDQESVVTQRENREENGHERRALEQHAYMFGDNIVAFGPPFHAFFGGECNSLAMASSMIFAPQQYMQNSKLGVRKAKAESPAEKSSRGLRHFSQKVMEKVKDRGRTTYNEVADELVREFGQRNDTLEGQSYDNKNIRRRVYDALNVLMAMNIIHKENKEIKWVGFPTDTIQECNTMEIKRNNLIKSVRERLDTMKDRISQMISIQKIMEENEAATAEDFNIPLPFAAVATPNYTNVDCGVNDLREQYLISFDAPFEVFDEAALVKTVSDCADMDKLIASGDLIKYKNVLPPTIHPYIDILSRVQNNAFEDHIIASREKIMKPLYTEYPFQHDINEDSIYIARVISNLNAQQVNDFQNNIIRNPNNFPNDQVHPPGDCTQ